MNVLDRAAIGIYDLADRVDIARRWSRWREQRRTDHDILDAINQAARGNVGTVEFTDEDHEAWEATGDLPILDRLVIDTREDDQLEKERGLLDAS